MKLQERNAPLRVDHHRAPSCAPFGPNKISIFCPRTLEEEFQVHAIKTGHISIIYEQTGGVCWFPARALQPLSD